MSSPLKSGPFIALLGFFAYSCSDVLNKSLLLGNAMSASLAVCFSLSLLIVLGWCAATGRMGLLHKANWKAAGVYSVFNLFCTYLFFYALPRMPMAEVAIITLTTPLITAALSAAILHEYLAHSTILALIVGFAAVPVMLAVWQGDFLMRAANYDWIAVVALFAHNLFFAARSIYVRRTSSQEPPEVILIAALASVAASMWVWGLAEQADFGTINLKTATLTGLALALGNLLTIRGFQIGPVSIAGGMHYSQMLWSALFGWLVFNETPTPWTVAGATLILASGWLLYQGSTPSSKRRT